MTTIQIPKRGGTWTLTVHDSDATLPSGAEMWNHWLFKLDTPGKLIGYVKRYGRTNGGRAEWHVVPWVAEDDGSKHWSLFIS